MVGISFIVILMESQQINKPLMNTAVLSMQTDSGSYQSAFIERYNRVVNCYNKNTDGDGAQMQVIVGNNFVFKISQMMNKPITIILLAFGMLVIPIFNFVCLACVVIYLYYLRRQNKKHLRNISRVSDPFQSFYYLPEMCQNLGKHYAVINLSQQELQGFTFNQQLRDKLAQKLKQRNITQKDQQLTVIIYDQYFYDSFYLYRQEYFKTLVCAFAGLIITTLSTVLYLKIFGII